MIACRHSWRDAGYSTHVDACDLDLEQCVHCGQYRMYVFGLGGPSDRWVKDEVAAMMLAADEAAEKKRLGSDWLAGDLAVRSEQGQTVEGVRQGVWSEWEDGRKTGEGRYRDGKKAGVWTHWDTFGRKVAKGAFKDGKKNGLWITWHGNGKKHEECEYRDGQPHGRCVVRTYSGGKSSEGRYRKGLPHGKWTTWFNQEWAGKASEGSYVDGKRDGTWTFWTGLGGSTVVEYRLGERV